MRVEHYDNDTRKMFVLMDDAPVSIKKEPDPSDFAACFNYWSARLEHYEALGKKLKGAERQSAIFQRDRAKAQVNRYKHLVPRSIIPLTMEAK